MADILAPFYTRHSCFYVRTVKRVLVTDTEVKKEVTNLDPKKAIPHGNIPIKQIKETPEVCSTFLTNIFNIGIKNGTFPD